MSNKARILLVEDEPGLVMTITDRLLASGYICESALDGASAWRQLEQAAFDLILLDIMLPDTDGFVLCQQLRAKNIRIPVLMLTARSAVDDRVRGLKAGADDYLGKPFSMAELLARIEAQLRRNRLAPLKVPGNPETGAATDESSPTLLEFEWFSLNLESRQLRVHDTVGRGVGGSHDVGLSATEFRLLAYLAHHPGRVLSREEILDAVWGYNNEVTSRTVDVHIAWLRKKLGELETPRHLHTVRRGGYQFQP
ncbi:MAG: response regulator transcription factor [Spirochaetales bacterium]